MASFNLITSLKTLSANTATQKIGASPFERGGYNSVHNTLHTCSSCLIPAFECTQVRIPVATFSGSSCLSCICPARQLQWHRHNSGHLPCSVTQGTQWKLRPRQKHPQEREQLHTCDQAVPSFLSLDVHGMPLCKCLFLKNQQAQTDMRSLPLPLVALFIPQLPPRPPAARVVAFP